MSYEFKLISYKEVQRLKMANVDIHNNLMQSQNELLQLDIHQYHVHKDIQLLVQIVL